MWVRTQTLPVIAVGDYNFDWDVVGGNQNHDLGYDNVINSGAWTWVRPATLIKSQCSPQFNSVLDFIFVNSPAQGWSGTSEILVEPNDCVFIPALRVTTHLFAGYSTWMAVNRHRSLREELLRRIEENRRRRTRCKLKEAVM